MSRTLRYVGKAKDPRDWHDRLNWEPQAVPSAGDTLEFGSMQDMGRAAAGWSLPDRMCVRVHGYTWDENDD